MKRLALSVVSCLVMAACGAPAAAPVEPETPAAAPDTQLLVEFLNVGMADKVGNEHFVERAGEGGQLVVVEYSVKNSGRLPIPAHEIPPIRLYDRDGVGYASDAGLTAALSTEEGVEDNTKLVSDLNPGITTKGWEVFEVSREAWQAGGWSLAWEGASPADLHKIDGPAA